MTLFEYDEKIREEGYPVIAGIDEAGRGPLAGPVVAGVVILPPDISIEGLNDSKKLSPKKRESLYHKITELALYFNVGIVGVEIIDRVNILNATYVAMNKALMHIALKPDLVLVDGYPIPGISYLQRGIISGDSLSASIAAASILAKVIRDKIMEIEDLRFPDYGFLSHRGYGTKNHLESLKTYGPSLIHRRSFSPVSASKICKAEALVSRLLNI